MTIYWLIFIFITWLSCKSNRRNQSFFFWISFLILMILGATRGSTVGNDMRGGYSEEFKTIHSNPNTWGQYMQQFEIGFSWIMGNFKDYIANDKMLFFHLLFIITFYLRSITIRKFSTNWICTLWFMYGLTYYFSLYNTMRQELAFSIICLFIPLALQKKFIHFSILTIITAYLFHKSQVALLLIIPLIVFFEKKWFSANYLISYVGISYFIGIFTTQKILSMLGSYAVFFENGNTNYANYMLFEDNIGQFSNLSNALRTLFCIYTIYLHRQSRSVFLLLYATGIIIANLLTPISGIFQRIADTFTFFCIFPFSYLWDNIHSHKERLVFRIAVILFMTIIFYRRLTTDNNEDIIPYVNYLFE